MFGRKEKDPSAQIKKRIKRKRRLNILKRLMLLVILVSVFGVLGYAFREALVNGDFNVKEIEVEGNEILSKEKIIEISGIEEGQNIFLVNLNDVRSSLNHAIITDQLLIEKKLPGKITIKVTDRPVLLAIQQDGKFYYADENLKIITVSDELAEESVPLVSGLESYGLGEIGSEVTASPDYKFGYIVDMLKTLRNNGLIGEISEISLLPDNTYRIITVKNSEFIVKDFSNFQEYFALIRENIENGAEKISINLTTGNYPIQKDR